jgi:hypothetical protein
MARNASLSGNFIFETTAFVDQAQDKEVAWQIGSYATLLAEKSHAKRAKRDINSKKPAFTVKIKMVQRSYVERLAIKVSIFGELCVYDPAEENKVLLRHSCYYIGRDTILSAKMQKKLVNKLLAKALKGKGGS